MQCCWKIDREYTQCYEKQRVYYTYQAFYRILFFQKPEDIRWSTKKIKGYTAYTLHYPVWRRLSDYSCCMQQLNVYLPINQMIWRLICTRKLVYCKNSNWWRICIWTAPSATSIAGFLLAPGSRLVRIHSDHISGRRRATSLS